MQALHGINVFNPLFFGFGEANMKNKEKVINPIGDKAVEDLKEQSFIWEGNDAEVNDEDDIDEDITDWDDEDEEDGYDPEWDGEDEPFIESDDGEGDFDSSGRAPDVNPYGEPDDRD